MKINNELLKFIKQLIDNEDVYLLESESDNQKATLCIKELTNGKLVYEVFKFSLDLPKNLRLQVDLGEFEYSEEGFSNAIEIFLANGGTIESIENRIEKQFYVL